MAAGERFIPAGDEPQLSPVLQTAAIWPALDAPLTLPEPDDRRHPGAAALADLEYLVGSWLGAHLQPEAPRARTGLDEQDRLTIRLGWTPAEWKARPAGAEGEQRPAARVRCAGFASARRHPTLPTFSFALRWQEALGAVDERALLARLEVVLPRDLFAELSQPRWRPRPHPSVKAADSYAATAILDPSGHGQIHQYLYLHASPTGLVGVFQHVPHESR